MPCEARLLVEKASNMSLSFSVIRPTWAANFLCSYIALVVAFSLQVDDCGGILVSMLLTTCARSVFGYCIFIALIGQRSKSKA